jgi:hypothetical protein
MPKLNTEVVMAVASLCNVLRRAVVAEVCRMWGGVAERRRLDRASPGAFAGGRGAWARPIEPLEPRVLFSLAATAGTGEITISNIPYDPSGPSDIEVDRSTDGVSWSPISATVSVDPTTGDTYIATDTGLAEDQTYYYCAGPSGSVDTTDVASATTLPLAPSGLSASVAGGGEMNVSWVNNTALSGAVVELEDSSDCGATWSGLDTSGLSSGATTWYGTGFSNDTRLLFRARAVASDGTASDPSDAVGAWTYTPGPDSLTAVSAGSTSIGLTWDGTNYSDFTGSPYARIYRSTDGGATFTEIADTSAFATSYTDTGLTSETDYTYQVVLVAGGHESDYSPTASAYAGPIAPTDLSATSTGGSTTLNWTFDNGDSEYPIQIYRSDDAGWTFTDIGSAGAGSISYTDTVTTPGTYLYQLREVDYSGNASDVVGPVSVTPPTITVSGTVFDDVNGDGVQDDGEPGRHLRRRSRRHHQFGRQLFPHRDRRRGRHRRLPHRRRRSQRALERNQPDHRVRSILGLRRRP